MTMGGAGTGTPPVDVLVEPPLDVDELVLLEVEVEELVLLDVEELVLLDVLVPPPKLLELDVDETLPLEVEVLVEPPLVLRSEEHTSELQSLMRISYAVFCLKKKKP